MVSALCLDKRQRGRGHDVLGRRGWSRLLSLFFSRIFKGTFCPGVGGCRVRAAFNVFNLPFFFFFFFLVNYVFKFIFNQRILALQYWFHFCHTWVWISQFSLDSQAWFKKLSVNVPSFLHSWKWWWRPHHFEVTSSVVWTLFSTK